VNFGSRELKALNTMLQKYRDDAAFRNTVDAYVSANGDKALGLFSAVTVSSDAPATTATVQPTTPNNATHIVPDATGHSIAPTPSTSSPVPGFDYTPTLGPVTVPATPASTPAPTQAPVAPAENIVIQRPYESQVRVILAEKTGEAMIDQINQHIQGKSEAEKQEIFDEVFRQMRAFYVQEGKKYIDQ
jgi:hypothetical protein